MVRLPVILLVLLFPLSLSAQEYSGSLFDTHTHLEEEEVLNPLVTNMDQNSVTAAVAFTDVFFDEELEEDVEEIREMTNDNPDKLVPFFNCDCDVSSDLTADIVQQVISADAGLFAGFGENALYSDPWSTEDITPNEEPFLSIYPTLTDNSLWIMFHPRPTHEQALDEVATNFPNQKSLIHGYAAREYISAVLQEHSNVYLTVDTAAILTRPGSDEGNTLLYAGDIDSAADFLAAYNSEKTTLMDNAVDIYKPIIEANPNHVMWGTDASQDWHVDSEVYGKLIEFSREFIAQLDSSVQEKYAITNAQSVFTPVAAQAGGGGDDDDEGDDEGDGGGGGGCSLLEKAPAESPLASFCLFFLLWAGLAGFYFLPNWRM